MTVAGGQLTDGLILGALLTILAWLFARAVGKSRKDSPDYGSDDLYLARIAGIILAEKRIRRGQEVLAGGDSGDKPDPSGSDDRTHRDGSVTP